MPDSGPIDRQQGGIQVISRAAMILRTLRDRPEGLSLSQIAGRVGLPRSTVQRIVNALVAEGLLMTASPAGRVRLGTEILALASGSRIDVVELAHPHIKALSDATGETVDLAVLKNDHLIFIDQVVGSQRLRAVSAVGETFPLHSTANGKACLALLTDAEIRQRLPDPLPPIADGTVRTIDDLLREIAAVRKTGVAYDEEEHTRGISAIGSAFRDLFGNICAVSVPAPTARFEAEREKLRPLLLECVRELKETFRG
jgi:DNA-binding IclR family transcriptional regulator